MVYLLKILDFLFIIGMWKYFIKNGYKSFDNYMVYKYFPQGYGLLIHFL